MGNREGMWASSRIKGWPPAENQQIIHFSILRGSQSHKHKKRIWPTSHMSMGDPCPELPGGSTACQHRDFSLVGVTAEDSVEPRCTQTSESQTESQYMMVVADTLLQQQ